MLLIDVETILVNQETDINTESNQEKVCSKM